MEGEETERTVTNWESTSERAALRQAASSLPGEERETLERALAAGYFAVPREVSVADIATDLGRPESDVRRHLLRGMARVARDLSLLE